MDSFDFIFNILYLVSLKIGGQLSRPRPELDCVNIGCDCSYYGGWHFEIWHYEILKNILGKTNGAINDCTLPNGQKVQKAIRKELRMLTDEERYDIVNLFNY